nr:putative acetoacetate--CoA ligase [uncultured bacterium]
MKDQLWAPAANAIDKTQLSALQNQIAKKYQQQFLCYEDFYHWSIENRCEFWDELWQFCGVQSSAPYTTALSNNDDFFNAEWFTGTRLNFAENLLKYCDDNIALVSILENGNRKTLTYRELHQQVANLATQLKADGIQPGDRVAGFMPNIAETVVAALATTRLGAIWSSCSPDFGVNGVVDRFGQIEPVILFCANGYYYNNKTIDCIPTIKAITEKISSIKKVCVVTVTDTNPDLLQIKNAVHYQDYAQQKSIEKCSFEQLPFDHPLYIMYSSGTTGAPKCIVHGAGGTLLQHLKEHQLHTNITRNDVLFYYSTCGWMMWNWLISGLASGCTVVLYDGSPFAKQGHQLLDAIDDEGITVFGASAKYISSLEKANIIPRESHRLNSLRTLLSTGSPLSHENFDYIYRDFKNDINLASICGGTDIISCFVLGNPNLPVVRGEIQCRGLGMAVEFWNEHGQAVTGEKGELVCTKPFPSRPIGFWKDKNNERYKSAYFATYNNVWAQGDYGELTLNHGVIIHGRSDAVLNPGGVRIGTAEIYRQVESIDAVKESIVVGQEWDDDIRVILFVVLKDHTNLSDALANTIKQTIRKNATPRHVPAKIIQVADIPRTVSGKIVELAVRNIIHNRPVVNTDALANPQALEHFKGLAELNS